MLWALAAIGSSLAAFFIGAAAGAARVEAEWARAFQPDDSDGTNPAADLLRPRDAGSSDAGPADERAYLDALRMRADPMAIPAAPEAPLEVLSASVRSHYSSKEVSFRVRSTVALPIDGIRFTVFCYDQFNDPVRNRHATTDFRTHALLATHQETIPPRASRNLGVWRLHGQPTCTKAIVVVREVHFEDGTEWTGYAVQQSDPRVPDEVAPRRRPPEPLPWGIPD